MSIGYMKVTKTFNASLAFTKKVKCSQTEITIKTDVKCKVLSFEYLQGAVREEDVYLHSTRANCLPFI